MKAFECFSKPFILLKGRKCGSSSVVERQPSKLDVRGSTPLIRFIFRSILELNVSCKGHFLELLNDNFELAILLTNKIQRMERNIKRYFFFLIGFSCVVPSVIHYNFSFYKVGRLLNNSTKRTGLNLKKESLLFFSSRETKKKKKKNRSLQCLVLQENDLFLIS